MLEMEVPNNLYSIDSQPEAQFNELEFRQVVNEAQAHEDWAQTISTDYYHLKREYDLDLPKERKLGGHYATLTKNFPLSDFDRGADSPNLAMFFNHLQTFRYKNPNFTFQEIINLWRSTSDDRGFDSFFDFINRNL